MNTCPWEEIEGFQSPSEFQGFERWMAEQIAAGNAEELPVDSASRGPYWRQRWFRHKASGEAWRLAEPDPPFTGLFQRVVAGC
jgi:hypothetical protein